MEQNIFFLLQHIKTNNLDFRDKNFRGSRQNWRQDCFLHTYISFTPFLWISASKDNSINGIKTGFPCCNTFRGQFFEIPNVKCKAGRRERPKRKSSESKTWPPRNTFCLNLFRYTLAANFWQTLSFLAAKKLKLSCLCKCVFKLIEIWSYFRSLGFNRFQKIGEKSEAMTHFSRIKWAPSGGAHKDVEKRRNAVRVGSASHLNINLSKRQYLHVKYWKGSRCHEKGKEIFPIK